MLSELLERKVFGLWNQQLGVREGEKGHTPMLIHSQCVTQAWCDIELLKLQTKVASQLGLKGQATRSDTTRQQQLLRYLA